MAELEYPQGALRIVVITAEEPAQSQTTYAAVRHWCARNTTPAPIAHLHLPFTPRRKADHLNHALEAIVHKGTDRPESEDQTYVVVFDADSRPARDCLLYLDRAIRDTRARALQIPSVYRAPATASDCLRAVATVHTGRTLSVEIPRLSPLRVRPAVYSYMVGHGQAVRLDLLMATGFPTAPLIDDLPLGLGLAIAREPVIVVPSLDYADGPPTVRALVNQTRTWFTAEGSFSEAVAIAHRISEERPMRKRRLLARCGLIASQAGWFVAPAITGLSLVSAMLGSRRAPVVGCVALVMSGAVQRRNAARLAEACGGSLGPPGSVLASAVAPLLRSIGPFDSVRRRLFGTQTPMNKTERDI